MRYLIIILFFLTSCRKQYYSESTNSTDTIFIKERVQAIRAYSKELKIPCNDRTINHNIIYSQTGEVEALKRNDSVIIRYKQAPAEYIDRYIYRTKDKEVFKDRQVVKEVIPKWVYIFIGIVILYFVIKYILLPKVLK
jgi:hypothetical protein